MLTANPPLISSLYFLGAAQFVIAMVIAEARFPGYNVGSNAISELGVGRTSRLFNASIIVFGTAIVCGHSSAVAFLVSCQRSLWSSLVSAPWEWGYSLRWLDDATSAVRS